jgi:hypothetical protein
MNMAEGLKTGFELQATEDVSNSQVIQLSDIATDDFQTDDQADDSADEGFVLQQGYLFQSVAIFSYFSSN